MKKELHLMIIWKNALSKKEEILKDLENNFKIRNKYYINWSKKNYSKNLSRFYGTALPDGCDKETHCGRGKFLLLILEDENPKYEERLTSHGNEVVNVNMFDKKTEYRKLTGGGHKIHATNNEDETNHDLTLLLGKNIDDFIKSVKPSNKIVDLDQDLFGAKGWTSVKEMFYALNNCLKYVVLRDFENDMDELNFAPNYDADLLCDDGKNAQWVLNADLEIIDNKKQYSAILNDKKCLFDIKYLSDDYYCEKLEKDILNTRIYHNGYYIPNKEYHYMSCLIHALIHKFNFEDEYNERLGMLFKKHDSNKTKDEFIRKASDWMKKHNYQITIPKDNYNNFNVENVCEFDKSLFKYCMEDYKNTKLNVSNYEQIKEEMNKYNDLEKEIKNLKEELNILTNKYNALNTEHNMIVNSKSWRLISKIRKIIKRK